MDLQKIGVKLFASDGCRPPLAEFVPVLHRWIQRGFLGGSLIDVVDYRHVHHGPGVMLIGFDFQLAIDEEGGERGLSVEWRRPLADDFGARVDRVLCVALDAAIELESIELPSGAVRFDRTRLDIRVGDRILAPSDDATWTQFRQVIEAGVGQLLRSNHVGLARDPDPRKRMTARITASPSFSLRVLRERLAATTPTSA
ncbi:MAG: hypothetical protein IPK07_22120 [Deltaproteobacteria bacterium]|jgi:hypothetical protein|nr:hypothetical protein [Deltaproteobacteria bacterium]